MHVVNHFNGRRNAKAVMSWSRRRVWREAMLNQLLRAKIEDFDAGDYSQWFWRSEEFMQFCR